MCADRIDILDALSKLTPAERSRLEDLVVRAIFREDDARRDGGGKEVGHHRRGVALLLDGALALL